MSAAGTVDVPISYCPACRLQIIDPFAWCHVCGGPTEDRVVTVGEVPAYASTTSHTGGQRRTLVLVDLAADLRVLADAPRPVAIGERGRLSVTATSPDGLDHYLFTPTTDEPAGGAR